MTTTQYQKLVGKLTYLSHTMLHIAFAVELVSQFMHSPYEKHLEAVYSSRRLRNRVQKHTLMQIGWAL